MIFICQNIFGTICPRVFTFLCLLASVLLSTVRLQFCCWFTLQQFHGACVLFLFYYGALQKTSYHSSLCV